MFDKVLVALDFSVHSREILERIPGIPGVKEVVLMHVVDATRPSGRVSINGPEVEKARIRMAEGREYLGHHGREGPVHAVTRVDLITEGSVAGRILAAAWDLGAGLIVLGARGTNPIEEILLGSVSSSVLRHAGAHVLVLRQGDGEQAGVTAPGLFSRVLVPTDFSAPAGGVVDLLRGLGGTGEILLLHVVSHAESEAELAELVEDARTRLSALRADLRAAGTGGKIRIRVGDPAEMILSVAREDGVSLIAMNAHGKDRVPGHLIGTTTFSVVKGAGTPVLVFRTVEKG
jgi:nucleotide-binding universal stress UspA family protein